MLVFPDEYFLTEVREGFAVNELMKRVWAAQLEILQRVIEICEKHHITYYAYWGTLLGAVRHHGYIPWDDDLDIAMKKEDYIRFLEVAKDELPSTYCVLNAYTERLYDDIFTRLTNRHAIDLSKEGLAQSYGCPFVVGIDIFPLYYLPRNKEDAEVQKLVMEMISSVSDLVDARDCMQKEGNYELANEYDMQIAEGLVELQDIISYQFTTDRPIKNQLLILFDQMSRLFGEEESDKVTVFPNYLRRGYCVDKRLLEESIQLPFENIQVNVPKGYDIILSKTYRDYMVPRRVRAAHDYPFFRGQLEILGRHIEQSDWKWKAEKHQKLLNNSSGMMVDDKTGMNLPQEWIKKIYSQGQAGRRKKIVLYHTGADVLLGNGEFVLEKLRYVLAVFKNQQEVLLWWFPCLLDSPNVEFIQLMSPRMVRDYREMIEEYRSADWGIYDESGDVERAVAMADAYYGDEGELMKLFQETGKCIMVQDFKLIKGG